MSIDAQVMTALADFKEAVKKQGLHREPTEAEVRAAANVAALELVRRLPALTDTPGQDAVQRMFLEAVAA